VEEALARHPEAVAVFCSEPSYLGTLSDVGGIVRVAHHRGVPVVVDQAWAAHLGFAPGYPRHALALGADAMVTSAHKTLPSFSQASIALARTDRLDPDRLERAFEATHTTSPSAAILASIDAGRALVAAPTGAELLTRLARLVAETRTRLRAEGLTVPGPEDFGPDGFDPAKLVLLFAGSGFSGLQVEADLLIAGMPVEMADRDTLVAQVGLVDDHMTLNALVEAVRGSLRRQNPGPERAVASEIPPLPPQRTTPREAFFARHTSVPRAEAVGRVSAELVAPYPPGVPVLVPGEEVTTDTLRLLDAALNAGTRIAYAADPTLSTVQVADIH
jgi:lysine decarboxylase